MAFTVDDVVEYVRCTFAYAELTATDKGPVVDVRPAVESCVDYLLKNEFIQLKSEYEIFSLFILFFYPFFFQLTTKNLSHRLS